mmetsp:Transcript_49345/g.113036  ORF Transcript_49345/g.113036 Transcript_49345/m.113036 type:complete len:203 (+) Transcript_49345:88-696(+)
MPAAQPQPASLELQGLSIERPQQSDATALCKTGTAYSAGKGGRDRVKSDRMGSRRILVLTLPDDFPSLAEVFLAVADADLHAAAATPTRVTIRIRAGTHLTESLPIEVRREIELCALAADVGDGLAAGAGPSAGAASAGTASWEADSRPQITFASSIIRRGDSSGGNGSSGSGSSGGCFVVRAGGCLRLSGLSLAAEGIKLE